MLLNKITKIITYILSTEIFNKLSPEEVGENYQRNVELKMKLISFI